MKITLSTTLLLSLFAMQPAFAGDIAAGEKTIKRCKACHSVASEDEVFLKGGKTGPNLYGVIGRVAGTAEGFKYTDDLVAAGAAGLVWSEENFALFVADPKTFLNDFSGASVKTAMTYKLKKGGEDVASYLATFSPAAPEGEEAAADAPAETPAAQ